VTDPVAAQRVITAGRGPFALYPHYCRVPCCRAEIDPARLMCGPCWRLVPPELRAEIWALSRREPSFTDDYLDAIMRAIEAVTDVDAEVTR
jgi:hypothetical protein